jgi:photosystem I P700 chlorophyll a apoprotein A1
LHADAHDFAIQDSSGPSISRKVFSANLAHLAVVFFWLGGMHFHSAYYSNYMAWLKDPLHVGPSSQTVWSIVGQDILNADVGGNFSGIYVTAGMFNIFRAEGIVNLVGLKYATLACMLGCFACLLGSYFHMHLSWLGPSIFQKYKSIGLHHIFILFGLGSLSWSAHQVHIAVPINKLLDSGVDPYSIPPYHEILVMNTFSTSDHSIFTRYLGDGLFSTGLNKTTGSLFLSQVAAHHYYVGLFFILVGLIVFVKAPSFNTVFGRGMTQGIGTSWNAALSIQLAATGSLSIVHSHHVTAMPAYPYLATDIPTMTSLFTHHMWIGGILIVGAGAHAAIYLIREYSSKYTSSDYAINPIFVIILAQRDIILGHLIYVSIFLGMHSFGMYIHNDTMYALGRPQDAFSDSGLQLKPVFALLLQSVGLHYDTELVSNKVVRVTQELGTSDFLVHHIHAFTIHVVTLILLKGVLYSRSSRLVSDKFTLGFRYPCDGPGRGGTCQISSWDAIFLGVFWYYNSISIVVFHNFWKIQSDVWGVYSPSTNTIAHISSGDWAYNSNNINGWLRNFLWSQAAPVIQSYGSSAGAYGLIFLLAHFVWAFSLMFLYSGRGYWQELIESIVWAHHKLWIVPSIQPRALSISQGRAVGLVHYIFGGIGCTWSFFLARALSVQK